ncbi:MAG TPA: hypothetical protein VJZ76_03140 [Thermoanaerobaculia bacterium]|nr:hypothetical protein [Thermoanaerobaculia bacterium]
MRSRRVLVLLTAIAATLVTALLAAPSAAPHHAGGGNVVVFGRNATIDHPVNGDVQVYRGTATVRDTIDGDLLVFGDGVTFEGNGRVLGDVILAGGAVKNGDGRIGGRLYTPGTIEGAMAMMTRTAVIVSLLLAWMIVAIVVTLMNGREIRFSSVEVRTSPLHCFALGLVAVTSFVLTAIVFSYLVPYLIGIPLLFALAVFAVLTKIYGTVALFHAVGTLVAGARTREQLAQRRWLRGDLAMVVVGVLVLGALRLIPVVGPLIWAFASVFGIGVALATKFGRREPWFLAWTPAEARAR